MIQVARECSSNANIDARYSDKCHSATEVCQRCERGANSPRKRPEHPPRKSTASSVFVENCARFYISVFVSTTKLKYLFPAICTKRYTLLHFIRSNVNQLPIFENIKGNIRGLWRFQYDIFHLRNVLKKVYKLIVM